MIKTVFLVAATAIIPLFSVQFAFAQQPLPQLGKAQVGEIVKMLTLEEKALLLTGTGLRFAGNGTAIGDADGRVPGAAGNTINITRFGIPGTVLADGPAGVRIDAFHKGDTSKSYYATAWPVGTLLASSWDTALVRKLGAAFGNEIKEYGIDVILAPGMNIQRNPLNGRNFEYFSEDPVVSGNMAAAMVNGIQSNGVGTSIKHFAANNQETYRNTINAIISERALREIYLKGFEIAVKRSQPWTVMTSYNKINGTYTSERNDLVTKILREEWGFKGLVTTDWYGGHDPVAQMNAGNDLLEPGNKRQQQAIIDAVKSGTLDMKVLDQNIEHMLTYILKTESFKHYQHSNTPDLKAHAIIARDAAAEGMVLLKNNKGALPLTKGKRIAFFGVGSYNTVIGGTGSGAVNVAYKVSIEKGLVNAGFSSNENLASIYAAQVKNDLRSHPEKNMTLGNTHLIPEPELKGEIINSAAESDDVGIYTIKRNAGEGADRKMADFSLSGIEQSQIRQLAEAFHAKGKKVIVILNIGGQIEMSSWRQNADAILLAWQPGIEAGNAIADILSGRANPSGKTATTFPVNYEDEPSAKTFPGSLTDVIYKEGIYVGYRYFNSFGVKPAVPFGFGMSYTTFSYTNLKLSAHTFNRKIVATVKITNKGKFAGKEIVQLYITAPHGSLDKPSEELKAFAKTNVLKPGEAQTLAFSLNPKDLASFDTGLSAWVADAGKYEVKIGASSEDIKLIKSFTLSKKTTVEKVHKALSPLVAIDELKHN